MIVFSLDSRGNTGRLDRPSAVSQDHFRTLVQKLSRPETSQAVLVYYVVVSTTLPLAIVQVQGRGSALQAYQVLLQALHAGAFEPGSRLPGERTLAEKLGVSRSTLRQVLTALAETGLLNPSPHRGWFVVEQRFSEGPNPLRSFTEIARSRGLTPSGLVLRQAVRPATLPEAETLALAPAAAVVELERLRAMDGVPFRIDYSCLPLVRVPGLDKLELTDCSLYELLSEHYDVIPTRCDVEVQAEAASGSTAALLLVEPGFPVLVGYQTTYDQHERPFDVGRVTYRGDAYRFKASLYR